MEKIIVDLKGARETTVVELPSYKGSQVEVFKALTVGETRDALDTENDFDRAVAMAVKSVKDWNLYETDEKKLPITKEIIEGMSQDDVMTIFCAAQGKTLEELKAKVENDPKE